uniref:Essential meiotic structure-specific endonuclease subunit 2 n=1 Tax=Ictidomys tridecemlineatus TaxID=43179 RepID=A0A287D6M8_ICTTR
MAEVRPERASPAGLPPAGKEGLTELSSAGPAVLEDTGADVLMEALGALGCECRIEPQRRARSLRWSGVRHDPCSVAPEVWSTEEQELLLLLLLEPEEFLQGTAQLTQTEGPPCPVPWISPESPAHPHLAVIGLDAHLWYHSPQDVEEAKALKTPLPLPFRQCWDSQAFSFCTAGRWAAGQQVARDGSGLRGVWWRQIRQFNRVSPAVADAIVTAFPSPRLLQQVSSQTQASRPPAHTFACPRRSWPAAQNRNV